MTPTARDILFCIVQRRHILYNMSMQLTDDELQKLRMQFYRRMRKDAFMKHLQPLIDSGIVIKQKDQHTKIWSYTTRYNEDIEADLARVAEKRKKAEEAKLAKEMKDKRGFIPAVPFKSFS
tara:strand:- start:437 stop:799 length:363 start_codon:yes stop_codon:yes gene_type:complete